jgi:predicted helicase
VNENAKHLWLTDGMADDWDDLIPLGSKEAKSGKGDGTLFDLFSPGVNSARDLWAYSFGEEGLQNNLEKTYSFYNKIVANRLYNGKLKDELHQDEINEHFISWSETLTRHLKRGIKLNFVKTNIRLSNYRPYTHKYIYFDQYLIDRRGQFPRIFPLPETENVVITVPSAGSNTTTFLASDKIVDLNFVASSSPVQCFPLYVYDEEGKNKKDNITDWGLEQFRNHYQDASIEKIDVYHYVYGILNDPAYREKYAANLKRELPRIPFRTDFWAYAEAGKKLMDIHIKYEDQDKYAVTEEWSLPKNYVHPHGIAVNSIEQVPLQERYYVSKMKRDKNDPTKLIYNDFLTISGIPSDIDEYKLGNRSALNWIIDQYQVSIDKRSGITNNPNDWSYESGNPRYILDLIQRIITVSMQTNAIVKGLPKE